MVVMRAVLSGLKQDRGGKFHTAFVDHADDPACLVPGDFLFHVASYLVLAGTLSGTLFPFLSFTTVFHSTFPARIGFYYGFAAMFRYNHTGICQMGCLRLIYVSFILFDCYFWRNRTHPL